ncbi:hypothetical protein HK096_009963 [Nowakowskiella sp. JEL0078]|nr:hypothetical protein HK096_009963 [Nowakowskiella sp. JEL0078]
MKYKKSQMGFFRTRLGGSLRGTTVHFGDFGLQAMEGGRLTDKQIDIARSAIRRVIKSEKGSKLYLRVFTDRPVTAKGAEARMGKGKGAVEYFASWISDRKVLFELKGVRKETAQRALQIASSCLPVKTKFVMAGENRVASRVLSYFLRKKIFEEKKDLRLKQCAQWANDALNKAAKASHVLT